MNVVVYSGSSKSRKIIRDYEFYANTSSNRGPKVKFNVLLTTYELILKDGKEKKRREEKRREKTTANSQTFPHPFALHRIFVLFLFLCRTILEGNQVGLLGSR
jgi:hypothetical protein